MQIIDTKNELTDFLNKNNGIKVYGARFKLRLFLEMLKILGYSTDYVKEILVSDMQGNQESVEGIPVRVYQKENYERGDLFFLTLASDYVMDVSEMLEKDGFRAVGVSERLLECEIVNYDYIYRDVSGMMSEFTNSFPDHVSGLNTPVYDGKKYAWTCWWQGMEAAPDLIKACINSMKRYLPQEVELVVITEDNYREYVDFPQYLFDKIAHNELTLTTFSDVIRASLLYKYGGIWLDSTLLLTDDVPAEIWDYELFTLKELRYCLPFIGGKAGQKWYHFLMEGFFYYYKKYEVTKYYLLVTYLLDIAKNRYPDIRDQYDRIPERSKKISRIENFDTLSHHIHETYTPEIYRKYMEGTYVHKLQRRFDKFGSRIHDQDNIYHYIVSQFL